MVTPKTEIMLTTHTKILNENILNKKSSMKTLTITLGQPLRPCQSYPLIFLRKIVYPHKFEKPLKSISPGYRKPSDREEVFGDDLPEIIQKENAANKLFNDALWQKHRSFQQYQPRTQPLSSFQFKKPNKFQQTSNYRGRGKGSNWNFRSQPQQQGNQQFGGQQNRQSSS